MQKEELLDILETLLFITDKPLTVKKACAVCELDSADEAVALINEIKHKYLTNGSSVQIVEVGGGYQMATKPEMGSWVRKLYNDKMLAKLSNATMETLAIIAYKQPITRAEAELIRGVDVIGSLETLIDKGLIKVVGRKESPGRPLLYATTSEFLRMFGLSSLGDLPKLSEFGLSDIELPSQPEVAQPELFDSGPGSDTLEAVDEEINKSSSDIEAEQQEILAASSSEDEEHGEDSVLNEDFASGPDEAIVIEEETGAQPQNILQEDNAFETKTDALPEEEPEEAN